MRRFRRAAALTRSLARIAHKLPSGGLAWCAQARTPCKYARSAESCSAPERIRTSDLRFRRPTLYPAELRAQRPAIVGPGTERAGFEPAMEFDPHTRLAGECLQPLGHLSGTSGQCKASITECRSSG